MKRMWAFVTEFVRRLWKDDVTSTAAQLAYYFLFSLFPLLIAMVALLPYLNRYVPVADAVQDMLERLRAIMPKEGMALIEKQFNPALVVVQSSKGLFRIGLLIALWSASRGVDALRSGLNRIYEVEDNRSYIRLQLRAIGLTVALSLLVVIAFVAIVLGGKAGLWISHKIGISNAIFVWARWPISAVVLITAINLAYWLLPNHKARFHPIDTGSVVATVLWIAATWGFTKYVEHFADYNATYGSIGSIIILLTWLYLSSLVFLLGAEVNATRAGLRAAVISKGSVHSSK